MFMDSIFSWKVVITAIEWYCFVNEMFLVWAWNWLHHRFLWFIWSKFVPVSEKRWWCEWKRRTWDHWCNYSIETLIYELAFHVIVLYDRACLWDLNSSIVRLHSGNGALYYINSYGKYFYYNEKKSPD